MRNQFFILLSVLLGQGRRMADVCIRGMLLHSHKKVLIDYCSGASGLPWAVDAATMLENVHSYAMALYRIGAAEAAGSKRHRAAFRLAQWLFDMGDGARLSPGCEPASESTGGVRVRRERLGSKRS